MANYQRQYYFWSLCFGHWGRWSWTVSGNCKTDELGCSLSNFAYVDAFLDEPVLDISGDDEISCAEPSAILEAGANEAVDEFVWTLPDGSMATGIEITTTQEGWHYVEAQNSNGCTGLDSFYVSYLNTQFVYDVQSSGPLSCPIRDNAAHQQQQPLR